MYVMGESDPFFLVLSHTWVLKNSLGIQGGGLGRSETAWSRGSMTRTGVSVVLVVHNTDPCVA